MREKHDCHVTRQVCERIREPSRLDADCVSGEGLHFSFPETYCNIFHESENRGIMNFSLLVRLAVTCARLKTINNDDITSGVIWIFRCSLCTIHRKLSYRQR